MIKNFPPNTDPNTFAILAAITGALISSDYNANELNSIGNWLELVAQYTLTVAAQRALITSRDSANTNAGINYQNLKREIDYIEEVLKNIQKEIDKIKKPN